MQQYGLALPLTYQLLSRLINWHEHLGVYLLLLSILTILHRIPTLLLFNFFLLRNRCLVLHRQVRTARHLLLLGLSFRQMRIGGGCHIHLLFRRSLELLAALFRFFNRRARILLHHFHGSLLRRTLLFFIDEALVLMELSRHNQIGYLHVLSHVLILPSGSNGR